MQRSNVTSTKTRIISRVHSHCSAAYKIYSHSLWISLRYNVLEYVAIKCNLFSGRMGKKMNVQFSVLLFSAVARCPVLYEIPSRNCLANVGPIYNVLARRALQPEIESCLTGNKLKIVGRPFQSVSFSISVHFYEIGFASSENHEICWHRFQKRA